MLPTDFPCLSINYKMQHFIKQKRDSLYFYFQSYFRHSLACPYATDVLKYLYHFHTDHIRSILWGFVVAVPLHKTLFPFCCHHSSNYHAVAQPLKFNSHDDSIMNPFLVLMLKGGVGYSHHLCSEDPFSIPQSQYPAHCAVVTSSAPVHSALDHHRRCFYN